jgi:tetratricopeptide (TPR) repeat protein
VQYRCAELLAQIEKSDPKVMRAILDRAIALVNEDLASDPYSFEKLSLLSKCYQLVNLIERNKVSKRPDDAAALEAVSQAVQAMADVNYRITLAQAREFTLRAIKLDPSNPDYGVHAAELEARLGGTRDAIDRLDEILKASPNHGAAQALRERLGAVSARPEP